MTTLPTIADDEISIDDEETCNQELEEEQEEEHVHVVVKYWRGNVINDCYLYT